MIYQYPAQPTNLLMPIHSWDVVAGALREFFTSNARDAGLLETFKDTFGWSLSNELRSKIDKSKHDAIVLTDARQNILWVNDLFTQLTGYQLNEALGRNPNFLQGKESDKIVTENIRDLLKKGESFTQTVLNFRKSGKPYHCCITVFPLYNQRNELVNYLAFEHEVDQDAA